MTAVSFFAPILSVGIKQKENSLLEWGRVQLLKDGETI